MEKIKLSKKQKEVIEGLREGKTLRQMNIYNDQHPTIKKLISAGLADWNSSYSNLKLTELGKKY